MSEDPTLAVLNLVHHTKSVSDEIQTALALALARSVGGNVTIPVTAATAIISILDLQGRMLAAFAEENQTIIEKVEAVVKRLEE